MLLTTTPTFLTFPSKQTTQRRTTERCFSPKCHSFQVLQLLFTVRYGSMSTFRTDYRRQRLIEFALLKSDYAHNCEERSKKKRLLPLTAHMGAMLCMLPFRVSRARALGISRTANRRPMLHYAKGISLGELRAIPHLCAATRSHMANISRRLLFTARSQMDSEDFIVLRCIKIGLETRFSVNRSYQRTNHWV